MKQPPFISEINTPATASANQNFEIQLSGNWPNPSWKYENTEIEIENDTRTVTISYYGSSSGGLAMQVLKPLSDTIILQLPLPGTWTIKIRGRVEIWTDEIEIS